jgi:hypothetical protein
MKSLSLGKANVEHPTYALAAMHFFVQMLSVGGDQDILNPIQSVDNNKRNP